MDTVKDAVQLKFENPGDKDSEVVKMLPKEDAVPETKEKIREFDRLFALEELQDADWQRIIKTKAPITERLVFLFSKVSSLELLQERQAFFLLVIMMIKIDPIFSVPHKKL